MKRWEAVDWVILVLAAAIAAALLVTVVVPVILGTPITDTRSRAIGTVTTAIISVISVYVGARIERRKEDIESDPE